MYTTSYIPIKSTQNNNNQQQLCFQKITLSK